jgi:hypothetical protein
MLRSPLMSYDGSDGFDQYEGVPQWLEPAPANIRQPRPLSGAVRR